MEMANQSPITKKPSTNRQIGSAPQTPSRAPSSYPHRPHLHRRRRRMNQLSLLHRAFDLPRLPPGRRHGRFATVVRARLSSPEGPVQHHEAGRLAVTTPQESIIEAATGPGTQQPRQESAAVDDGGRTCALPTWALVGGIAAGVAAALVLSAGAGPAQALGPEGPLVEEFWDNMRRYALYALTVSTGVAYTVLQPIVELLKNPVTALLIVAVLAGSGFLVSQVLNAMVGNSDFIYMYEQ